MRNLFSTKVKIILVVAALLTAALEAKFGVPAANASILRTEFLTADKQKFE